MVVWIVEVERVNKNENKYVKNDNWIIVLVSLYVCKIIYVCIYMGKRCVKIQ